MQVRHSTQRRTPYEPAAVKLGNHHIHKWTVADEVERLLLVTTTDDKHKVCFQLDNLSFYVLCDTGVWVQLNLTPKASDDFSDEVLHSYRWEDTGTVGIQFNNQRLGRSVQLSQLARVDHKAILTGDFDVHTYVDLTTNANGYYGGLHFTTSFDVQDQVISMMRNNNGFWTAIEGNIKTAGSSASSFFMRVRRVGSIGYTYTSSDGVNWTQRHTRTVSTADGYIRLNTSVNSGAPPQQCSTWFRNIVFVQGTFTNGFEL